MRDEPRTPLGHLSRAHGAAMHAVIVRFATVGLIAALTGGAPLGAQQAAATDSAPPARIEFPAGGFHMKTGETGRLDVRVVNSEGKDLEGVQTSFYVVFPRGAGSDRLVVDAETGEVSALKGGEYDVIVTAMAPDLWTNATVKVYVEYPPIDHIVIARGRDRLFAGSSLRYLAEVYDAAGDLRHDMPVRWSTNDGRIASVDAHGVVTAERPGRVNLAVEAGGARQARTIEIEPNPIRSVSLAATQTSGRTGDVIHFTPTALDASGEEVRDGTVEFSLLSYPADVAIADGPPAEIDARGRFVANHPGVYTVLAQVSGRSARTTVEIVPRDVARNVTFVGQGPVHDVRTSDLWVWEGVDGRDYAVTGTWQAGGWTYFWDVTDPTSIIKADSVWVDARTINDVKISEDGRLAVLSREGASNRRNGIVIVDVSDPYHVEVISSFDDGLTGGVHNVFIHDGHVYAVNAGVRFDIIDISDPRRPHRVGLFELDTPAHYVHDVWVVDGIAYSSQVFDGVVIVDVGGGDRGGSPSNPVEMARFAVSGGVHSALPYSSPTGKFYLFLGNELAGDRFDGLKPNVPEQMGGYIHVVDFTDPERPEEVARYEVPEAGSHNFWVEDDVLYVAYYNAGLRVVDVSGELKGNLSRQGREMARYKAYDPDSHVANAPFSWGPQPYKGNVFVAESYSGLWAVKVHPPAKLIP